MGKRLCSTLCLGLPGLHQRWLISDLKLLNTQTADTDLQPLLWNRNHGWVKAGKLLGATQPPLDTSKVALATPMCETLYRFRYIVEKVLGVMDSLTAPQRLATPKGADGWP